MAALVIFEVREFSEEGQRLQTQYLVSGFFEGRELFFCKFDVTGINVGGEQ